VFDFAHPGGSVATPLARGDFLTAERLSVPERSHPANVIARSGATKQSQLTHRRPSLRGVSERCERTTRQSHTPRLRLPAGPPLSRDFLGSDPCLMCLSSPALHRFLHSHALGPAGVILPRRERTDRRGISNAATPPDCFAAISNRDGTASPRFACDDGAGRGLIKADGFGAIGTGT